MGIPSNKIITQERPPWDMEDEVNSMKESEKQQVTEMRRKISEMVHDKAWQKLRSRRSVEMSIKFAEAQVGDVPKETEANDSPEVHAESLEGLLMTYEFMSKEWKAAQNRLERIQRIISVLPDHYQQVLLKKLVLNGKYDLNEENAATFERLILVKIKNFEENNQEFEAFTKHPLAKQPEIVKLKIEGIQLSDKKSFMEANGRQRRQFLKEIKDALLKEEAMEAYQNKDRLKMVNLYKQRLDGYYFDAGNPKGCIGEATYNAYANECESLDLATLKIWHQELKNQMAPRAVFWKKVRSTLSGPGLTTMENQMHKMGLGGLKKLYPEVRKTESERLCFDYNKALLPYLKDGTIGEHSAQAFRDWMAVMPLTTQYQAKDLLEDWEAMGKYKALRAKIKTLPEDQQTIFESNRDKWGYSECTKELERLGTTLPKPPKSEEALKGIQNHSIREAAVELKDDLENKGGLAQEKIINLLQRQGRAVQIVEFEKKVQAEAEEAASQNQNFEVGQLDRQDTDAHLDILEEDDRMHVTDWSTFQEIEGGDGQDARHVVLSEEEGMNKLLSEYRDSDKEAHTTTISLQDANQQEIKLSKQHAANIAVYLKEELKQAA